jgi:y4mF family transcriptional regulator
MKVRTPFEELAATMAARKDPIAEAMCGSDPVQLQILREREKALYGQTNVSKGIEEAIKGLASTEAALGINRTTAEAILGYKPGATTIEAALGHKPGGAVMEAAKGIGQLISAAALGGVPLSLKDDMDRMSAGLTVSELYRSPARDVLDEIAVHPDLKPANRGRRVTPPATPPQPVKAVAAIPITSVADIGKRVRETRKAMKMTQQRFADMAGVGRRFLIELEQGKPSLEIGRVLAVCHAAGFKLAFTQ